MSAKLVDGQTQQELLRSRNIQLKAILARLAGCPTGRGVLRRDGTGASLALYRARILQLHARIRAGDGGGRMTFRADDRMQQSGQKSAKGYELPRRKAEL